MIKAVFFDLFFTLVYPHCLDENEYDVIGISLSEWEKYAENDALYNERASGKIKTERKIIDKIVDTMPYKVSEEQKQMILQRREERMRKALLTIDDKILDTISQVRFKGVKTGLISNVDIIDSKYWDESPLSELFDIVVFSCDVGTLKPQKEIYSLAMNKLNILPENSIFIGDGGSNEIFGAKSAGMKTIFTEYLERKSESQRKKIIKYADYHIDNFDELLKYID